MSDWKQGDIVLSQRSGTVFEYLGIGAMSRPRWDQLSPPMGLVEGYDPAEPVLLARRVGEKRLPVLDFEGMTDRSGEPRCYHMAGATWQGKCIDCGAVCAPNLDDVSGRQLEPDHEPVDYLLPYFGPEDGAE